MSWREEALCAETNPEAFHPKVGESSAPAKRICGMCPVRVECLEYALVTMQPDGIWGGASPRERRLMRRGVAA